MAEHRSVPSTTGESKLRGARGPYAKTGDRRSEILDAAVEVFSRSGYVSASIRDIADRLGVSHATLIFHFGSKEGLLAAVLERSDESHKAVLDRAQQTPIDFLAYVLEFFRLRSGEPGSSEMFLRLAVEAAEPTHPAHPYMIRRYRRLQDTFISVFKNLDEYGLLRRPAHAPRLARFTIALMDGLQISAQYDPGRDGVAADLEAQFAAVLNAEGRRRLESCRAKSTQGTFITAE